ncbi:hypothetical protein HPP92_019072 [Vanilla planifolia]|uniref:Uncharacterized protein n=1 Tax=Vanilla planifolia TaxID=51239 RepID=A0A835QE56_VANPL|nr:hypothetical protein HPP92_019072 [Vanilla planifolia]
MRTTRATPTSNADIIRDPTGSKENGKMVTTERPSISRSEKVRPNRTSGGSADGRGREKHQEARSPRRMMRETGLVTRETVRTEGLGKVIDAKVHSSCARERLPVRFRAREGGSIKKLQPRSVSERAGSSLGDGKGTSGRPGSDRGAD